MRRPNAFTLIELLIVVAIIAILAAIAVPNFLEAQTRSKISRAKSDLRTMATALEAYAVDNNVYPYAENLPGQPWLPPGGSPRVNPSNAQVGGLTSPIAYITSLPIDVFEHPISTGFRVKAPVYYERAGFTFDNGTLMTSRAVTVPADAVGVVGKYDGIGADDTTSCNHPNLTPARYVLYSLGPDIQFHLVDLDSGVQVSASRYNLNNRYDSTNGTISAGNVLRYPGGSGYPE